MNEQDRMAMADIQASEGRAEREYPTREIFAYGLYLNCQILNWDDGPPPKYLICHPLSPTYREDFLAKQGMGTWMRIDLRDALRDLQP